MKSYNVPLFSYNVSFSYIDGINNFNILNLEVGNHQC